MWSFRAWRRRRLLARHPVAEELWQRVRRHLPILDGLDADEDRRLRERAVLFLADKHLTALAGVDLDDFGRLLLAAQAQLPLLHLPELNWYQGFHELVLYPDDFVSPQKHRDASGVVHEFDDERSGETSLQGPVVLAWPGVVGGGGWDAYNLVIHELAHKLDMLNGDANGLPPLHAGMRIGDWASAMQAAYDEMNALLDRDPDAQTAIDPYAAEDPAEFFAVTSEYFFTAPDLLHEAYPAVYRQLQLFYRQDPLQRLRRLQAEHPDTARRRATRLTAECRYMASTTEYAYNRGLFFGQKPLESPMSYSKIPAGKDLPNDIYVAIEIPANHAPIKYEIDKDTDCLFVDRFMATPMFYPANYGFIPNTLADDGDPLDVLVVTPYPVAPGSVIRARPVGVLHMTDEAGGDAKLIAVPHDKLSVLYKDVKEYTDLPALLLEQIKHFFENYKDLEKGKWVKVEGWGNADAARAEITKAVAAFQK